MPDTASNLTQEEVAQLGELLDDDLYAMFDLLNRPDPLPPAHVRVITSSILRRWFVESWISKLANSTNSNITLPVLDNSSVIDSIETQQAITFFVTGGVRLDGKIHWGMYSTSEPFDGKPPINFSNPQYVEVNPGKFMKQRRLYFENEWFTTEEIVKFVSNKAGGVHLNQRGLSTNQKKLVRANKYLRLGNPGSEVERKLLESTCVNGEEELLVVLPKEKGHVWNSTDIEMLSAAQSFINMRLNGTPYLALPSELLDLSDETQQEIVRRDKRNL